MKHARGYSLAHGISHHSVNMQYFSKIVIFPIYYTLWATILCYFLILEKYHDLLVFIIIRTICNVWANSNTVLCDVMMTKATK